MQEKWEELVVELCQRLTSEEGKEEEKEEEKEVAGEGRGRQTLLHFGASLGLCRLVLFSLIKRTNLTESKYWIPHPRPPVP